MLFSARSAPDRDALLLRSVRQALNTPVVAISELPVGPATAAIAVHDGAEQGCPHWTLAVRSERTRGVVFFAVQQETESTGSYTAEAVLSLAEGMGFLFEEAWVVAEASGASKEAERVWEAFASGAAPSALRPGQSGPQRLLSKFRRALPWNREKIGQPEGCWAGPAVAASLPGDEFKELEPQLAHRGDG
jgi:hypothetical protein